jgi:hypothetical protein
MKTNQVMMFCVSVSIMYQNTIADPTASMGID